MALDATMTMYSFSARMTWDATMNRDYISAKTTYVMWREESLWDVGVLQSIYLSNSVILHVLLLKCAAMHTQKFKKNKLASCL
jgi:hypothetical protein